jgi:hypothetical protein
MSARFRGSHCGEYENGCLQGCWRLAFLKKFSDVSELLAASIRAIKMEAERTS